MPPSAFGTVEINSVKKRSNLASAAGATTNMTNDKHAVTLDKAIDRSQAAGTYRGELTSVVLGLSALFVTGITIKYVFFSKII